MPLDAIYLSAVKDELEARIVGGKIDKVQQPERDTVLLTIRSNNENLNSRRWPYWYCISLLYKAYAPRI